MGEVVEINRAARPEPSALRAEGHPGAGRDPDAIRRFQRLLELYVSYYRPEVRGFDALPGEGPFLVVGNHSGGATPPDMPILMTQWWRERGVEEPVYGLFHSTFIALPGVRGPLTKFGALEAGWEASEAVLADGGIVVVYPGGDQECFRPWNQRNRIEFAGRKGFIRLALRARVPIVPVVTHGVQDSILVLSRGERLLPFMPHVRAMGLKIAPVVVGLPWGVTVGLPTIPLPTKVTVQIGDPIDLSSEYPAAVAGDERIVDEIYERITGRMQETLDDLVDERRRGAPWPLSLFR